jgi:hypothetical protein
MVAKSNKHYNETLLFWMAASPTRQFDQRSCRVQIHCGLAHQFLVVKINCLRKIKEERKRSNTQIKNTRIYVVRQYAYIHRRRQGESFTKKIGRLQ